MNTLQTIWSALTVPNELLFKIISIPLVYIDAYIMMNFFTTLLNIDVSRKRKYLYVLLYGTLGTILGFLIPSTYKIFINIIIWPIIIYFVFKTTVIKALLAEIITLIITSVLEFIFANIFLTAFNLTSEMILVIPIYRIAIAVSIYLIVFLITKLVNLFKINIEIFDNMSTKTKVLLIVNALLIILVLAMQFYLITFYSNTMPLFITIINIIGLIAYFTISLYSIINSSKLASTKIDLENANNTIHSLTILHDQVRSFKHDFDNMVNSIGGYVVNEDIECLKKYYNQLLEECHKTNNLYALYRYAVVS